MTLNLTTTNCDYTVTVTNYGVADTDNNASVYDNMPNKGDQLAAIVDQARSAFSVAKEQASLAAAHTYKLWAEIYYSTEAEEWFKAALVTRNEQISAENKKNAGQAGYTKQLEIKSREGASQFNVIVKYALDFVYAAQASNVSRYVQVLEWLHKQFNGQIVANTSAIVDVITAAGGIEAVILAQRGTKPSPVKQPAASNDNAQNVKAAEKYEVLKAANTLCEVAFNAKCVNNGYVVLIGRVVGAKVEVLGELPITQARLDAEVANIDEMYFQAADANQPAA